MRRSTDGPIGAAEPVVVARARPVSMTVTIVVLVAAATAVGVGVADGSPVAPLVEGAVLATLFAGGAWWAWGRNAILVDDDGILVRDRGRVARSFRWDQVEAVEWYRGRLPIARGVGACLMVTPVVGTVTPIVDVDDAAVVAALAADADEGTRCQAPVCNVVVVWPWERRALTRRATAVLAGIERRLGPDGSAPPLR